MTASRIVPGVVAHARTRPKPHRLRYSIFQLLLDLDELTDLDNRLRLFSVDRFNLISFRAADHLDPDGPPLRRQVEDLLRAADVELDGGAIRLLAMPRLLGQVFNPLSLFFCHRPDGGLAAIIYEVNNTFGERHLYVLPVAEDEAYSHRVIQACEKSFFVSPLMPMALRYGFDVRRGGERWAVHIKASDAQGELLRANFQGRAEPLSDLALMRAWAGAPLLSLKVLAAIHWEALWTWRKGARLQSRRPTTEMGITIGAATAADAARHRAA